MGNRNTTIQEHVTVGNRNTIIQEHVTVKFFLNREGTKVLFAEAKKDFVDVLFSFLTLPLGTIARLVRKESNIPPIRVASLSSLYQSVEDLDNDYLCADVCKEMLLLPKNSMEAYCKNVNLNIDDTEPTKYFVCNHLGCLLLKSPVLLSTSNSNRCSCGDMYARPISHQSSDVDDGFVQSTVSFLIMDELYVVPNSLVTFFSLLKISGINDMSLVNEVTVTLTKNKVLDLMKNCLVSKTPLTDFFLEKRLCGTIFNSLEFRCDVNASGSGNIMVKIMQRKSNGKILFAQGKEDFANFLFSFLTLPLGAVSHLMEGGFSDWSIHRLYKSVINLEENIFKSKELKNKFVNPVLAPEYNFSNLLLPIHFDIPRYFCVTEFDLYRKFTAWYLSSTKMQSDSFRFCTDTDFLDYVEGYVKGPTMIMATDDLVVTPMSSTCVMSLLNCLNIPITDLEEKEVCIGVQEGVGILQASLISTSALTIGLSHLLSKEKREN